MGGDTTVVVLDIHRHKKINGHTTMSASNFDGTAVIWEYFQEFWKDFGDFILAISGTFLIHFYQFGKFC